MSSPKSDRQLLFKRVHKHKIAASLSKNIDHLLKTEERLSSSRLSSASSSSLNSLRRAYSTASHHKSTSKQKMLKDIIEKLRHAKMGKETPTRETPIKGSGQSYLQQSQGRGNGKNGSRVNKLEEMMKDIKKCNQMSTKAVYSIKKDINQQLSTAAPKREQGKGKHSSILLLVNQLSSLKQELVNIKQENKQLLTIIQQQKKRECPNCNCFCHIDK